MAEVKHQVIEKFRHVDTNRSGTIDRQLLREALRRLDPKAISDEAADWPLLCFRCSIRFCGFIHVLLNSRSFMGVSDSGSNIN